MVEDLMDEKGPIIKTLPENPFRRGNNAPPKMPRGKGNNALPKNAPPMPGGKGNNALPKMSGVKRQKSL